MENSKYKNKNIEKKFSSKNSQNSHDWLINFFSVIIMYIVLTNIRQNKNKKTK